MTPRQKFQMDESKLIWLKEVLNHPVTQEALAIVDYETRAKQPTPIPGVDLSQQMSIEGAKSVGASNFHYLLLSLTEKPAPREKAPEENYRDQAFEQMKASGQYRDDAEIKELLKNVQ